MPEGLRDAVAEALKDLLSKKKVDKSFKTQGSCYAVSFHIFQALRKKNWICRWRTSRSQHAFVIVTYRTFNYILDPTIGQFLDRFPDLKANAITLPGDFLVLWKKKEGEGEGGEKGINDIYRIEPEVGDSLIYIHTYDAEQDPISKLHERWLGSDDLRGWQLQTILAMDRLLFSLEDDIKKLLGNGIRTFASIQKEDGEV